MTARQVWEAILVETSKQRVQPMLLEDFNYLFNKTILMYIDKVYHSFGVNQKIDDNMRVLVSSAKLDADQGGLKKATWYSNEFFNGLSGAYYEVNLPLDYLHILNVMGVFEVMEQKDCYDKGEYITRPCVRMTSDISSIVQEDFYNRPSIRKPYYFIKNVNVNLDVPTNPYTGGESLSREETGTDGELPTSIDIGGEESLIEKNAPNRFGNASPIRLEIRYGKDDTVFKLVAVVIDYLKSPQHIRLTQKQIDMVKDTSQILEFPDVTCQEIINDFTSIYMENTSDQRLTNQIQVNQAVQNGIPVGAPAQAQATAAQA